MTTPIKVLGFCGSLRPQAFSRAALLLALEMAEKQGVTVEFFDPLMHTLPLCTGAKEYPDYPAVELLKKKSIEADAFILSTPEYHGSYSGVIKNTLDLLSFDELSGKIFGAISVLGGVHNSNALNDLRIVTRQVHGWMVTEQLAIPQAWKQFDAEGKLTDPKLEERLQGLVDSVVTKTNLLRRGGET
jgi:FMN reductase